jgi:hypothetical protein
MKNLILFSFTLWSTVATAQSSGNYQQNLSNGASSVKNQPIQMNVPLTDNVIILQSEVLYNAKPQSYLAIFAVHQEDSTLELTDKYMNQRLDLFKNNLLNMGIASSQIFFDFVSLVPKYEVRNDSKKSIAKSKSFNEVPIGFQLKKNVHVSFTDGRLIDRIISAAAQAEIYDLAKVEVNSSDLKRIYEELRAESMKIIQAKAALYAPLGIKMFPLTLGDHFETYYPTENYEDYTAFVTDYNQLQSNRTRQGKLNIRYANKEKTVFYSRLPYDQFDQVINPDFSEPPIQIHYKLQVKYQIQNTELAQKAEIERQKALEREEIARKGNLEVQKAQAEHPAQVCCPPKQ